MRSETGTKSGESGVVTLSTNLMMDCFVGPSFHDGERIGGLRGADGKS